VDQTTTVAARIERSIQGLEGVKRFWTYASAGYATIVIDVEPGVQQAQRMDLFRIRLRSRIPPSFGTVTIDDSFDRASRSTLAESVEEQPFADETGSEYRFLLKGTDAHALRLAADDLTTRLARLDLGRRDIEREWPEPSPRVELVPKSGVAPEIAVAAAAALVERTLPPAEQHLPDGRFLRVAPPDAPLSPNDVPLRSDVFARPLRLGNQLIAIDHAFEVRASSINGGMTRELGRFVLPVNVRVHAPSPEQALAKRKDVDRTVGLTLLPAGVVAVRPSLDSWKFSAAKLRLVALSAFLPILLFTAAAMTLGSLGRALIALTPAALALAFVAPALTIATARLDELTLLAVGAALCCVVAATTAMFLRFVDRGAGRAYRALRGHGRAAIVATIGGALLLGIAASARPAIGDAWRAPLLAAATIVATGVPAATLLPAAIEILLRDLRRRRGAAARAVAHPALWADESALPQLSVRNVTKVYATGFRALQRVSFDLTPGVIGLLGPNGAGKTTLLRILTGLLQPTRGLVSYQGVPIREENIADFRRSIGFLPQEFNAYAGLTAAQFLDFWALERGMSDPAERRRQIEELLVVVGLDEHADRRVRHFSGGMRQRIGIARALLANPPLLVVDEPTTGLDIDARRRFRDLLMALARNRIVILSSHIASDVETTAMRILLLVKGRLQWEGSVDGLVARARGRVFETVVSDSEIHSMAQRYRITTRVRLASGVRVRGVAGDSEPLPGNAVEPSLEEAYLSEVSTGGPIRRGSFSFLWTS
jgi:ABC-type multidrug transport system ATPase subunit